MKKKADRRPAFEILDKHGTTRDATYHKRGIHQYSMQSPSVIKNKAGRRTAPKILDKHGMTRDATYHKRGIHQYTRLVPALPPPGVVGNPLALLRWIGTHIGIGPSGEIWRSWVWRSPRASPPQKKTQKHTIL